MNFNINEVLAQMTAAVKKTLSDDWPEVKSALNLFLQNRKARLELLAEFRIKNTISADEFKSRLEDEKIMLESEMHVVAIISKSMAQKAANAAIQVLDKAVKALIPL